MTGVTMASTVDFVEYVCSQINDAGDISYRKMFGEYAVYCNGKVIGLICDNQFFVKITAAAEALSPALEQAPPYPGAKPYLVIDSLDDREFLTNLIVKTSDILPDPKPKKGKSKN
jgi:TfoX/Sxy family transcriptional regulator of competence genes